MATVAPASSARRGLAFLAGVGFAAVPTVGPYVALLALASGGLQIQRADRWWWLAALLLGLPWMVAGAFWAGIGATAQVVAVWLIFRAAAEVRRAVRGTTLPFDAGAGLLVGLAAAMALGLERSATWRLDSARSAIDVFAWTASPALYGHAMLLLAALLAVVVPSVALRVLALGLGAVAVIVSGSHEAVLAWLVIAIGLRFVGRRGGRAAVAAEWALVVLMLAVATGLTTLVGLGRTGFRLDILPPVAGANLFRGTEVAIGEWWYPLGVDVATEGVTIAGEARTGYRVTKSEAATYARLQQLVELRPDTAYVLAVAWQAQSGARPGLDGWGRIGNSERIVNLAATWRDAGWVAEASGPIQVLASEARALDGGWVRGSVAFRYEGPEPVVWFVGAVPDRSSAVGATTTFAEFQLIQGDAWLPYVPNAADVRLADMRTTRLPLWRQAGEAIARRPWLGWGPGGYATAQEALRPEDAAFVPTAAHAHNVLLDVLTERGLVGLSGLLLLAGVLSLRILQQRDRAMAVVLAGVVVLGTFDTTLLNGAVIYPLAAVIGWRALGHRSPARAETGAGSAALVRLALAASDVAVAMAAITAGLLAAGKGGAGAMLDAWTPALVYATLLWPAFAWANGLYPGYGRVFHDELARGTRAAWTATVSLGFLALVLPAAILPIPPVAVLVAGVVTTFLAPVARFAAKNLLSVARLWGRPVAILGTGPTGERIARYLLEHPRVGLMPIAAFGEAAWRLDDLPVTGSLERAWVGLQALAVRHVIVTPESAGAAGYDEILRHTRRSLPIVHFVPDLHGVPASSVVAAPLGTSLGLEMRNQLASGFNRAVKRAFDITAVTVGGLVILPVLVALAVAIRLDSPGPVLYRQRRIGRDGKPFRVWKFRTMVRDAEQRLAALLASDDRARAEWEATQKLVRDPRVTRVGQLLRKTSLDELPQLWNVLMGEMSLVGPRPIVQDEVAKYAGAFDLYTQVRPGITGFWQVSGRSDTSYEYRVDLDTYYVRNWSVWLDIEILLRTVRVVLRREGAY